MPKSIIYQMLPRIWGAHDSASSGKFSDINAATFEYLKWLGADTVWYTGIIRHSQGKPFVKGAAGSPYAIYDYYDVNPYLATDPSRRMEEFEDLIRRTHDAGLKVVIDFIPNHVGRDNINFGTEDDTTIHWKDENDFYYYPGSALRLPVAGDYYECPAKASGNCFSPAPGINDWYETVRLNYCDFHTATWDKMLQILRFWAAKGVDGFRCDMVEMVPWQFFAWVIPALKADYPDIKFIAEVYRKDYYHKYIHEVKFDLLYDKSGLYDTLRSVVQNGADVRRISGCWQAFGDYENNLLNFLENHDEQRLASAFFAGDASVGIAPLAVSLLMKKSPFMLYFGQELGEKAMDAEGFSGVDGRTSIFDWCSPATIHNLCEQLGAGGAQAVISAPGSLLARYRELLSFAATSPAIGCGRMFDLCYCNTSTPGYDASRHYSFLRSDGKECYLILCNFSDQDCQVRLNIPVEAGEYLRYKLERTAPEMCVKAHDAGILQL